MVTMSATRSAIDEQVVLDTFLHLVRIDSPSGQEGAVADFLEPLLRQLGCETWRDATGNLLGRRGGASEAISSGALDGSALTSRAERRSGGAADGASPSARPLLLSAHMDTVQPGCGIQPQIADGVVRSDGSTILGADDKAGITAIVEALRAIADAGVRCRPLELAFTVQEETGLTGAKGLDTATLRARQAVVLDSNGPVGTIVNQAPASDALYAVVSGKAAHAGVSPELGINALQAVAQALAPMRLGRIDSETTANFGVIAGGTASNIVPDRVTLKGEARSRDEQKLAQQTGHMVELLRAAAERLGAHAEVTVTRSYGAIDVPESSPLIREIAAAIRASGLEPSLQPTGGGSDANVFNAAGIEAVNLGVGYANPHSVDEHIAVRDLVKITEVLRTLLTAAP